MVQPFRGFQRGAGCARMGAMNEQEDPNRKYRWPWLVGAAVLLAIVLAVGWVAFAARKVEQQREGRTPLPNSAPVR